MSPTSIISEECTTFGKMLKCLRHKARVIQRELASAIRYGDTQICMPTNQEWKGSLK